MPTIVWPFVLDTGYDTSERSFNEAYAESALSTHRHDWTAFNNGEAGPEDNWHGTLMTDLQDQINYGGGTLWIHQVGHTDVVDSFDVREALTDIVNNHWFGVDVVAMSLGFSHAVPGVCMDLFDDLLETIVVDLEKYVAAALGNEGQPMHYPGSSTFTIGVGGIDYNSGDHWLQRPGTPYGFVALNDNPLDCPEQRAFHMAADDASHIFKPDVYGVYWIKTDLAGTQGGTSPATQEVASGLATIASRVYVGKDATWIPFKSWNGQEGCWEGAWRLVRESNGPNGQEVTPPASSRAGNLADHDAWFLDDPYRCGSGSPSP